MLWMLWCHTCTQVKNTYIFVGLSVYCRCLLIHGKETTQEGSIRRLQLNMISKLLHLLSFVMGVTYWEHIYYLFCSWSVSFTRKEKCENNTFWFFLSLPLIFVCRFHEYLMGQRNSLHQKGPQPVWDEGGAGAVWPGGGWEGGEVELQCSNSSIVLCHVCLM